MTNTNTTLAQLTARVDPAYIYPPFWTACLELLANCQKRGCDYFMISGFRSDSQQLALWAQGRTQPGKIVTNAKPWTSYHNYGLALDFCRDSNIDRAGLQPDWAPEAYDVLAEEATMLGLDAGHYWKSFRDSPHVQFRLPKDLKLSDLPKDLQLAWAKIGGAGVGK